MNTQLYILHTDKAKGLIRVQGQLQQGIVLEEDIGQGWKELRVAIEERTMPREEFPKQYCSQNSTAV